MRHQGCGGRQRTGELVEQVLAFKKDAKETPSAYISRFELSVRRALDAGGHISDIVLGRVILQGLPASYQPLRDAIAGEIAEPTMYAIKERIKRFGASLSSAPDENPHAWFEVSVDRL